jgi:hypothetical protein
MCALGCRVDIKNKKEMTPLHTATEKNEIDAVRCLCLAGLDLNITNKVNNKLCLFYLLLIILFVFYRKV